MFHLPSAIAGLAVGFVICFVLYAIGKLAKK